MSKSHLVVMENRDVTIEVVVTGDHPSVLLLPSAQRSVADFAGLSDSLWEAGFGTVAANMRGVGRSTGLREGVMLRDIADDVADVANEVVGGPVHIVGHALGNVFARATAAYRPETVASVSLLACGGHDLHQVQLPTEMLEHFERCCRVELPDAQRLESLQAVFFAPGNDPAQWLTGWWPSGDLRQVFDGTDPAEWATAGEADVLVLQPMEDTIDRKSVV